LAAGKSIELKLNVTRTNGHSLRLVAIATDLPPGITASSPSAPAAGGAIKLTLSAAADAKAANQPFHILLVSLDHANPFARPAIIDLAAKETNPDLLVNQLDAPWLTVIGAAPSTQPTTSPVATTSTDEKPRKKSKSK